MPVIARRRTRTALALLALCAAAGCVRNPESEAKQQELNIQMGDAINHIQGQVSDQAATIDSLRTVIAKQDTTLQRMAAVTGVPIAK